MSSLSLAKHREVAPAPILTRASPALEQIPAVCKALGQMINLFSPISSCL